MMGASELAAGVPITGIQWKPKPNMKRRETLVATFWRTNLKCRGGERGQEETVGRGEEERKRGERKGQ